MVKKIARPSEAPWPTPSTSAQTTSPPSGANQAPARPTALAATVPAISACWFRARCARTGITIEPVNDDFKKVVVSYGFMESPNVPKALAQLRKTQGLKFDIMATSFFLGRRSVVPSAQSGMPLWQDKLFIFLMKNAANPTDFYKIPPGRVVEMGTQVTV